MNLKTLVNGIGLLIGLGLVGWSLFTEKRSPVAWQLEPQDRADADVVADLERWNLKPGSIYDGDTLRVVRGSEELKIRFCGIDAPEKKQKLGVESRDHLRSLIGNKEILLIPVEEDRYGRTVAEVYVEQNGTPVNLNLQMVRDGMAWHYAQYSGNCPAYNEYAIAENLAKDEDLGIWNGSSTPPWEWRKANK